MSGRATCGLFELWSNSSTPSKGPVITHNSSILETYSLSLPLSTPIASSNDGATILISPLHSPLFPCSPTLISSSSCPLQLLIHSQPSFTHYATQNVRPFRPARCATSIATIDRLHLQDAKPNLPKIPRHRIEPRRDCNSSPKPFPAIMDQ